MNVLIKTIVNVSTPVNTTLSHFQEIIKMLNLKYFCFIPLYFAILNCAPDNVIIHKSEMSSNMELQVVSETLNLLEKGFDLNAIAKKITDTMDSMYGPTWICKTGVNSNFSEVKSDAKELTFIWFSVQDKDFAIYRQNSEIHVTSKSTVAHTTVPTTVSPTHTTIQTTVSPTHTTTQTIPITVQTTHSTITEKLTTINSVTTASSSHGLDPSLCKTEGYFRNPHDCTLYYRCVKLNDKLTLFDYGHQPCDPGLVFDEDRQSCIKKEDSKPCHNQP
jgi:hypothetical protein